MQNRPFLLIAFLFYNGLCAQPQDIKALTSKITAVTVFQNGAQVTRVLSTSLPAGRHSLVFTEITQNMDPNSIQLKGTGQLSILSIAHQRNHLTEEDKSEAMLTLEQKIEELTGKINEHNATKDALAREKEMILANRQIGGSKVGYSLQQLEQIANFFRNRIAAINLALTEIDKKLTELERIRQKWQLQLNQERQAFSKKTSQVAVQVEVMASTTARFENSLTW
ncbi:MAG: DUF4140 domain-containing protein [Owenweeksia sp.]|nr:DUF4140 domain-containing protein [Owenweeksia sp.]